ncbi:MAG: hypothetical protein JW838_10800 [Spirochaetes bacterium]|nr:hypothetical protein [Spirochaetota bacterium]
MDESVQSVNRAYVAEGDNVFLANSIFGENYCRELQAIDKHEIVVKICDILGADPSNLRLAETIFEELKFEIARYVIHHEYCRQNGVCSQLLLWLDGIISPANAKKLSRFMAKYLK